MSETQELHCHKCGSYLTFKTRPELTGNIIIICKCGHQHCRVVKDGEVTRDRWDSRSKLVSKQLAVTRDRSIYSTHSGRKGGEHGTFLQQAWSNLIR